MTSSNGEGETLDAGMPVESVDGTGIGTLASVLVDEETEEAGFLVVSAAGADRLVPIEAVADVEDGTIILDVEVEAVARLPQASADRDPTDAEIDLAYKVLGFEEEESPQP